MYIRVRMYTKYLNIGKVDRIVNSSYRVLTIVHKHWELFISCKHFHVAREVYMQTA